MKFARYFQDSQTSEWKKAYIDYHSLKVQLRIIRAKSLRQTDTWSSFGGTDIDHTLHLSPDNEETNDGFEEVSLNRRTATSARIPSTWTSGTDPTTNDTMDSSGHGPVSSMRQRMSHQEVSSFGLSLASPPLRMSGTVSNGSYLQTLLLPKTRRSFQAKGSGPPTPVTFHTLLSNLPTIHVEFFDMLDAELDKVETFYTERAKEMHERAKMLRKQLDELGIHREMFYESSAQSKTQSWAKRAYLSIPSALSPLILRFQDTRRGGHRDFVDTSNSGRQAPEHRHPHADHSESRRNGVASGAAEADYSTPSFATLNDAAGLLGERWNSFPSVSPSARKRPLDPHEYRRAKRRLRHAVIEHYRGLEVLNNYRILNLAGFRKALRKYGKITRISVMDAYMKEKVEPSAFGSGAMVSTMLKEMEHLFAVRFEHGDRKKAVGRLRVSPSSKTYHSATFRSGLWLGLALPAIAGGFYLCFQEYTRKTLPSWNILLFIYSIFAVPVFLALLIGINILVWVHKKISYIFIFRLNLNSRLDHHQYFELPSFLLCTLAYAFWFSFAQLGSPMLWPLIWLALTLAVMLNPLRVRLSITFGFSSPGSDVNRPDKQGFMWGGARWWTIKKIAKLGASGRWEVEFTDVWLGDQFCSLVYSLSNLYFVGCFYTRFSINPASSIVRSLINSKSSLAFQSLPSLAYAPQAQEAWSTCGISRNWGWYYLLCMLPFLVRFAQNLRRYWDSRLVSQLLNAGKYATGMIYYLSYCYWRHHRNSHSGKSYVLWCFAATVNAIYGCVWDMTMDWALCKPHARYPLLRQELVYKSHISLYYISMLSNICIRFNWVAFIFVDETNFETCAFIVALLEMLRRVLWNFYRLENKHLHNTGLHRIMHEVPLPYNLEVLTKEEAQLRKRIARLS